jgi:hypothetical protein
MLCEKVVPLLSEYSDGAMEIATANQISQHLDQCAACRKEFSEIDAVRRKLKLLRGIQPPPYLRDMVRLRVAELPGNRWHVQLRDAVELKWASICTMERSWYTTKAFGTLVTAVFFFLITCSINPLDIEANSQAQERKVFTRAEKTQVALNVVANLGMLPKEDRGEFTESRKPTVRPAAVQPAIHDQYLSEFGQSISQEGNDYDFSVVTYVDRSGQANAQTVLEHPNAETFLKSFNKVISSGRFAPKRENGKPVPSHMLLMFSKISVYD